MLNLELIYFKFLNNNSDYEIESCYILFNLIFF